jgi:hypothetical protein
MKQDEEGNKEALPEEKKPDEPPVKRLRRSSRTTNRLVLPHPTSLAYRRLDELFFQSYTGLGQVNYRKWTLQRVHCDPNIYVIDDFLTSKEVSYFHRRIEQGGFERSFVDQLSAEKKGDSTVFDDSNTCYHEVSPRYLRN